MKHITQLLARFRQNRVLLMAAIAMGGGMLLPLVWADSAQARGHMLPSGEVRDGSVCEETLLAILDRSTPGLGHDDLHALFDRIVMGWIVPSKTVRHSNRRGPLLLAWQLPPELAVLGAPAARPSASDAQVAVLALEVFIVSGVGVESRQLPQPLPAAQTWSVMLSPEHLEPGQTDTVFVQLYCQLGDRGGEGGAGTTDQSDRTLLGQTIQTIVQVETIDRSTQTQLDQALNALGRSGQDTWQNRTLVYEQFELSAEALETIRQAAATGDRDAVERWQARTRSLLAGWATEVPAIEVTEIFGAP